MINYNKIFYEEAFNKKLEEEDFLKTSLDTSKEFVSKGLEVYFNTKTLTVEEDVKGIEKYNKNVSERLDSDINQFNFKIKKLVDKVKGAILVERNSTSTIFSTIIPINKQQMDEEKTTAEISEGVIFGISTKKVESKTVQPFTLSDLVFKNLRIKSLNKKSVDVLEDFEISDHIHNNTPFEISLDLRGKIKNDTQVILDLNQYAIIELYLDGVLFKLKSLSNYFSIPVNENTLNVGLRVYPSLHKSNTLSFKVFGRTDLIYQDEVVYESKQIPINQTLSHFVLDTCDNNTDNKVEIDYSVSINGGDYERVEEVSKQSRSKLTNIQSIIGVSKDTELDLISSVGVKVNDSEFNYQLPPEIQNQVDFEVDVLIPIGYGFNYDEVFINIKQDFHIRKTDLSNNDVYIDGVLVTDEFAFLPKGLRKVTVLSDYLPADYLRSLFKEDVYQARIKKPLLKNSDSSKYISMTGAELYKYFKNISPETPLFFKRDSSSLFVNTIKVKATLKSLDYKTVPYISRFLVRGV